ncbi:SDR family NAD(P)-dependent oxidoreductase [Flavobacterium defluvii]|uniref:NAD(P)-dependent dehydrogenase, short-chain alcohol dehydrogenase family n=1 Tax=Flavobacterium defluvii TaxID=370979 RepID=A0A1M5WMK6_9FLAO|nr:SDR family oxidoreductase [Flavobacterium defluvii]SHH88810.1 NAD(P)-dependent dehydrogenase, short-chain alcohol dehydrogenase family [Flavobacterium defluvii]
MSVENKIAVVTGGSRGLGKDMALNLAKKGLNVVLTYNSQKEEAQNVVKQIEQIGQIGVALKLDVSDTSSFDLFRKTLSETLSNHFKTDKIDFLINNAGFIHYANFAEITETQFTEMENVHFKGPFFLTQKLLPLFNANGGIVNVSSGLTRFATPGFSAYASFKGGMETLTKYLAKELGDRRIRVNSIAPGAIETDIMGGAVRDNAEMNQYLASQTALGRVGLPEDIGGVVAFLCTDEAGWINAQRIEISGGSNL